MERSSSGSPGPVHEINLTPGCRLIKTHVRERSVIAVRLLTPNLATASKDADLWEERKQAIGIAHYELFGLSRV